MKRKDVKYSCGYILLDLFFLVVFVSIALMLLTSCSNGTEATIGEPYYVGLEYFVVDGMPCLQQNTDTGGGITCDWSKWEGAVDGDVIVLP